MVAWWVVPDGRYVAMNNTVDVLTDVIVELEDFRRARQELRDSVADSRRSVSESRKARLHRSSNLRLVWNKSI
jgi:hypothetical protein